ncbi:uncharacterized protein VNE69_04010 [Vairimorpha necatrix]|uniref:IDEAL domain-containing protein n=1 Tax=Vairimorpha necatrix TaxID=6039 RepID=A0AAX4JBD8_9MICR
MNLDQEMTKILAKVMHNSYKRKEVNELIERIIEKMDKIIKTDNLEEEFLRLKEEYYNILQDIKTYHN